MKKVDFALEHLNIFNEGAKRKSINLSKKQKFEVIMKEFKRGTLHSGSGNIVTNRKQAIAIAVSETRGLK